MDRKKPARQRRPLLSLVLFLVPTVASGAVLAIACGGRVEGVPDDRANVVPSEPPKGGTTVRPPGDRTRPSAGCTTVQANVCPDKAPSEVDWCPRPHATCSYADTCSQRPANASATRQFDCEGSRWTLTSTRYDVTCPEDPPKTGDACEPGCVYVVPCSYATACGNASAVCEPMSATWHVTGKTCAPDGGADAGADASTEAGPDASTEAGSDAG